MFQEEDSWSILCELQRELKKEFLLVEKEQQEKIKLKREIEDSIRSYHSLTIEIREPRAELLKDEGFGNCYNFIKDVVIGISTSILLGKKIVYLAEDQSTLVNLIIQNFYENIETNDPYLKDITKLMHMLMGELFHTEQQISRLQKQRIIQAWKYYMEKVDHEHYFQQISNSTLRELLKEDKKPNRNSIKSDKDEENDNDFSYSWEVKNKDQLIQQFIDKIQREAQLSPASIKIPLRAAYESIQSDEETKINCTWQLISSFYLKPFKAVSINPALPVHLKERILNFVDDLITKCRFVSELSHENLGQNKTKNSVNSLSIERICKSLIDLNEARYRETFLQTEQAANPLSIQIKIVGASLNLIQLHELLILLNTHKQAFAKVSERVIHRTQRIFEMSPNLLILKRQKPAALVFVSLAELRYEQSISSDYYKNYSNIYRSQTLKQILKQVLVELQSLGDYRTTKKIIFSEIFSSIVQRNMQAKSKNNLSAQQEMKVKYLVYLLKGKDIDQFKIIQEMNEDLRARNSINIKLFEDTKFSLLKVYCNLRNIKLQLRGRQESERKGRSKLVLLDKIESFSLDYCISSRASRNRSMGEEQLDQYRYRMSSADEILISPIGCCIHKDNMFTGTQCHASSISKFLKILTNLPEVRYFVGNPSFINSERHSQLYLYCNENKIRSAFSQFVREIIEKLKLEQEEKSMLESILYRRLNELLLGRADSPFCFPKDRQLSDKIEILLLERNGREVESPRKNDKKHRGSVIYEDTPLKTLQISMKGDLDSIQYDQLIEIGARHILSLNQVSSPQEKARKLKELLETYRVVIDKNDPRAAEILEKLLVNSIVQAKLPNLVSTLSYLSMFLPEDKLISSEGMILKQFERAVLKIFEGVYSDRQHLDRSRISDC